MSIPITCQSFVSHLFWRCWDLLCITALPCYFTFLNIFSLPCHQKHDWHLRWRCSTDCSTSHFPDMLLKRGRFNSPMYCSLHSSWHLIYLQLFHWNKMEYLLLTKTYVVFLAATLSPSLSSLPALFSTSRHHLSFDNRPSQVTILLLILPVHR